MTFGPMVSFARGLTMIDRSGMSFHSIAKRDRILTAAIMVTVQFRLHLILVSALAAPTPSVRG